MTHRTCYRLSLQKPRARRVTLAAAVLGAGVSGVLVVLNWGTVRDHFEAWHFQLTRETETMDPGPPLRDPPMFDLKDWLVLLTTASDQSAIFAPTQEVESGLPCVFSFPRDQSHGSAILDVLGTHGWRVIEQRFPRRAYVVIRDPAAAPSALWSGYATVDDTSWLQDITPAVETESE